MKEQLSSPKIRRHHLDRRAYIYVRQSTLYQVRHNTVSTLQQYDWVERAGALGWGRENIVVIDHDQARSGTTTDGRDGFKRMLSEVALGNVGAVLTQKDDRLARDGYAWQRLLKYCEINETLIIDQSGIYDPRNFEDRLVLGIKGVMSEAEGNVITERMRSAKMRKAEEAQLCYRLPIGYVHDSDGKIILDPNEEVQHVIRLVFDMFEQSSSAQAMVKSFNSKKLLFPKRINGGPHHDELRWSYLPYDRALDLLHNPCYTGAYVYGRTRTLKSVSPEASFDVRSKVIKLKMKDWAILKHSSHQEYITWDQYLINQERIRSNNHHLESNSGAVRDGNALLQGIAVCGRCGKRMKVRYSKGKKFPVYCCNGTELMQAEKRICQQFSHRRVDEAVEKLFLQAVEPAQLELSVSIFNHIAAQSKYVERQKALRREGAQYEADLAYRRYAAVEPENRLVARNLERMWNEKLAALDALDREVDNGPFSPLSQIGPEERVSILNLERDLPEAWQSDMTTPAERKQLLRCLIKDVVLTRMESTVLANIKWQTGNYTQLEVTLLSSADHHRTSQKVIDMIRELAPNHTGQQTADRLNEAGFLTSKNKPFDRSTVCRLRYAYNLPKFKTAPRTRRPRADGRYGTREAGQILGISRSALFRMCSQGRLDAIQLKKHGHWEIKLTPEIIIELKKSHRKRVRRRTSS